MTTTETHRAINAVWRIESAKLIAGLTRMVGDVGIAEDLAQDALLVALERWPESGVPDNPGAWLMTTAKRRAIDLLRRDKRLDRKHEQLGHELEAEQERAVPDLDAALDDHVGDDLLRLMFISCHPVLSTEARVALTLRLLGGLTTDEIARAFLVPIATMAQRIVRAKRILSDAKVPFEVPRGAELEARLASVLEVLYLVFNEGYSATAGDDWMRPALCEDALRLAACWRSSPRGEPEVHGLVALMEIQASRARARVNAVGRADPAARPGPRRSGTVCSSGAGSRRSIAPRRSAARRDPTRCRRRSRRVMRGPWRPTTTDWTRIAALYEALARLAPSPVVELNRAVAVSMAFGPAAGLELVDALVPEPSLTGLSPAAERAGRPADEARPERTRRGWSSSAPPPSRETRANRPSCSRAPPPADPSACP